MSKEIKKSWDELKWARETLTNGDIGIKKFNAAFDEFYAVIEPLIENLEDDDSELAEN